MFLSIIIPTYNEAEMIEKTINHLQECVLGNNYEIIICDGGSTDATCQTVKNLNIQLLNAPILGRAGQMNHGVTFAKGNILYFVHADSLPPKTFFDDIKIAVNNNFDCGSFMTKFDSNSFLLKINAFFTRFNYLFFRGGDQSIFITRDLWQKVGGYNESMLIMEDYDFLKRIWQNGKFKLIKKATLISARKYKQNSWLTVQLANLKIVKMYKKGASQNDMISTYKKMLNYRNNAF